LLLSGDSNQGVLDLSPKPARFASLRIDSRLVGDGSGAAPQFERTCESRARFVGSGFPPNEISERFVSALF